MQQRMFLMVFFMFSVSAFGQKASLSFQFEGRNYLVQQEVDVAKKFVYQSVGYEVPLVNEFGKPITSGLFRNLVYRVSFNGEQAKNLSSKLRIIEEVQLLYHNAKNAQFQRFYTLEIAIKGGAFSDILLVGMSDNPKAYKALELIKRQKIYISDNYNFKHLLVDQLVAFNWDKGIIKLIPTQENDLEFVEKLPNNQIKK